MIGIAAELTSTPPLALPVAFEAVAITTAAVSGALHATRREFDVMGTLAIAFVTGLGGGVIRDILLEQGTPGFLTNPRYLLFAALGSVLGFFFARWVRSWTGAISVFDVATLGVWVILACQKSIDAQLPVIAVVFVGVVAAVGGGLLRDLLCGDTPTAFTPGQWNAFAALWAAVTFVVVNQIPTPWWFDIVATLSVAAGLRWLSMRFDLQTPVSPAVAKVRAPG